MDEKFEKQSLQEKIKMLDRMKKLKEAEIRLKEEELEKEIEELQLKRVRDIKQMEDELVKEEKTLDEEMMKAMNELLFRERREYSLQHARGQRILDFSGNSEQMSEVFLYRLADSVFTNPNMKLHNAVRYPTYERVENFNSSAPSLEQYTLETSSYAHQSGGYANSESTYQSNSNASKSMYVNDGLHRADMEMERRRRMYESR